MDDKEDNKQIQQAQYSPFELRLMEVFGWDHDDIVSYRKACAEFKLEFPKTAPTKHNCPRCDTELEKTKDGLKCDNCDSHKDLPKNLGEAVNYVYDRFRGMEQTMCGMDEDTFAAFCHSQTSGGIGMSIRNDLNLWEEESELHKHFRMRGLKHPDEMSDRIIRSVYRRMMTKQTYTSDMDCPECAKEKAHVKMEHFEGCLTCNRCGYTIS